LCIILLKQWSKTRISHLVARLFFKFLLPTTGYRAESRSGTGRLANSHAGDPNSINAQHAKGKGVENVFGDYLACGIDIFKGLKLIQTRMIKFRDYRIKLPFQNPEINGNTYLVKFLSGDNRFNNPIVPMELGAITIVST
jgi:hypothetical protein